MANKELGDRLWKDIFGDKEWASDCFGTLMHRDAQSNEAVVMIKPGTNQKYDYSWNIDHIRPKASYTNESDADFMNNYEIMHRQNNQAKSDDYPHFKVNDKSYKVVSGEHGYGIYSNEKSERVDWKHTQGRHYR